MKAIYIFLIIFSQKVYAENIKSFNIENGSIWKLSKEIQLEKNPTILGSPEKYTATFDLKTGVFIKSQVAKSDICLIQVEPTSKQSREGNMKMSLGELFVISSTYETLEKITIELVEPDAKQPTEKIKIECSAYTNGLGTERLKTEFKSKVVNSLKQFFVMNSLP